MTKTLQDVADRLRRAGATIPAPENKGSVESAMATGLSIALVLVEEALENAARAPTVISHFKMREVSATPDGPEIGGFIDTAAFMAQRVKELEAEAEEMRTTMTSDLLVVGKMRGDLEAKISRLEREKADVQADDSAVMAGQDAAEFRIKELEAEVASLKDSSGNKHLLDLCTELQERVAYAEKDRDAALAEKDAALAFTRDKTKRMGRHIARMVQALGFYADPETYFAIGFMGDSPHGAFLDDFEEVDGVQRPGKKARAALDETATISPEDLEALRQAIREGVQEGFAPLRIVTEGTHEPQT